MNIHDIFGLVHNSNKLNKLKKFSINDVSDEDILDDQLKHELEFQQNDYTPKEAVQALLSTQQFAVYNVASVILKAMEHNPYSFSLAGEMLKNNYRFCYFVLKRNGCLLKYVGPNRRNRQMQLVAVSNNGLALKFVEPIIYQGEEDARQNYKKIVLRAVINNGLALEYATNELRDDDEIVSTAISNNPLALEFASARIKQERQSVKTVDYNDTWTDPDTSLMWQVDVEENKYTFEEASKYVDKLNKQKYARYNDWRIPKKEEIKTLITSDAYECSNRNSYNIKIDLLESLKHCDKHSASYWTSDNSNNNGTDYVWKANFFKGNIFDDHKSSINYIRCVRKINQKNKNHDEENKESYNKNDDIALKEESQKKLIEKENSQILQNVNNEFKFEKKIKQKEEKLSKITKKNHLKKIEITLFGFVSLILLIIFSLYNNNSYINETTSTLNNDKKLNVLNIKTSPSGTTIKIMNIRPVFKQSIKLKDDKYDIFVSKKGYETYRQWITLNKDTNLNITLKPITE